MLSYPELLKEVQERSAYLHISLARAKEVADRVNDTAFIKWIDAELKGYVNAMCTVPEYRVFNLPLSAELIVPGWGRQWKNLPDDSVRRLEEKVGCSLSVLSIGDPVERLVQATWSPSSHVIYTASAKALSALQEEFSGAGFPQNWVTQLGWMFSLEQVHSLVDHVRHEFYNRLLALRKAQPSLAEEGVTRQAPGGGATTTQPNTGVNYVDHSDRSVTINIGTGTFHGPFVVASRIKESFNTIGGLKDETPLKELLDALAKAVVTAVAVLPEKEAGTLAKDLESIVTEATTDAREGVLKMLGKEIKSVVAGVRDSAIGTAVTSALSPVLAYFGISL
jgi:AbiTii